MNLALLSRLFLIILSLGGFLYGYITAQNRITDLRLRIPQEEEKLKEIVQESTRLHYELEKMQNPTFLIELRQKEEYCHLKHPMAKEIIEFP